MRATAALITTLVLLGLALSVRGGEKPLEVAGTRPLPGAEQRRIRGLIDALAGLDEWRDGITPSSSGCSFAPLDDDPEDKAKPADRAFRELVSLGPKAMPFLLERLDDPTPTKLEIEHEGGFGMMSLGAEVESNPKEAAEIAAIRTALPAYTPDQEEDPGLDLFITKHTVTVGDACFVILGQITNRGYEALRYQGTACNVVNSPTRTARLARAVRAQWVGKDLRRELARRLLADFRTAPEGSWRAEDGDLQAGGLVRLAWFYGSEAAPLVTGYIAAIGEEDLARGEDPRNGLYYDRLFYGLARVEEPRIRAALVPLLFESTDRDTVESLLAAVPDDRSQKLLDHLEAVISANLHRTWSFRWLFHEIRRRWPERLPEVLLWHYEEHGDLAVRDLVELGYEDGVQLPAETWATLLGVTRKAVSWQRLGNPHPLERLRVCDVAALMISKERPDLAFDEKADITERDAAIEKMREALK